VCVRETDIPDRSMTETWVVPEVGAVLP
jgi:hypothetical protein